MIARLRARHRWVWVGLLIVAPAVLMEALSVRRETEHAQSLPVSLGGTGSDVAAVIQERGWHWTRNTDDGRLALEVEVWSPPEVEVLSPSGDDAPDTLLYWSLTSSPELDGWLQDDSRSPLDTRAPGRNCIKLPPDAVLLGPWAHGSVQRLHVPAGLEARQGVLVWYSVGHGCVSDAYQATEILEPPP